MRAKTICINGKEYPVCFSARVLLSLEARGGDADQELSRIIGEHKLTDMFWLFHQMLDAGARWADMEGIPHPEPISLDHLIDSISVDELRTIFSSITNTIADDSTTTVEVAPGKNVEATPGD